jgi:hypothetical protein
MKSLQTHVGTHRAAGGLLRPARQYFAWAVLCTTVLVAPPTPTLAHENPLPSASLVQRDGGHLTLTLRLDPARALHRTLQSAAAPLESLALLSAMDPARFAVLWEQATRQWSQACTVVLSGRTVAASRWTWPPAKDAQAYLQQQLMPQLTGGHADHELLSAQAEFRVGTDPVLKAQLNLPATLRPLTLTTLRPRQKWSGEGDTPIPLNF